MNFRLFYLLLFSNLLTGFSQDLIGGIGSFTDDSSFSNNWYSETNSKGSFSTTTNGYYYGSASLKVEVTSNNTSDVRMHNRAASYFNVTDSGKYTISFYAKGTVGNDFSITLMNGSTNVVTSDTQQIGLDEWMFYTLTLTSNVTSSEGRIKFNFLNEGVYEIDELIVKSGGFDIWYVDDIGNNSNSGNDINSPYLTINKAISSWTSGDLIYVRGGIYQNSDYNSGNLTNGSVVYINKAGSLNGPLVIRNYPGETPIVQFDGSGGFICGTGQYLEISGFEISGPNASIEKSDAEAERASVVAGNTANNYYKGRGIAVWAGSGGHHILLHSNKVHHTPASGIRINNSDYCTITNNEVYECTTWSHAAESSIVLAQSKQIDTDTKIKMRITKNKTYDNVNKIHYFNSFYACSNNTDYGCENYPDIIDGSGCYITRNNDRGTGANDENPNGQYVGYFYFANNISYGNGINGLVVHKSDNSIVMNNTIYNNGAVPLDEGRQSAGGITVNNSTGVKMYNNISWTRYNTDYGYKVYGTTSVDGSNNLLFNGLSDNNSLTNMIISDPLFVDTNNADFRLNTTSPALHSGVENANISLLSGTVISEYTPSFDYANNKRAYYGTDIGAHESVISTWSGAAGDNPNNLNNWSDSSVPDSLIGLVDIDSNDQVTWNADFTTGAINISSGGTLVTSHNITATINYSRTLGTNKWYLVSSPVVEETIEDVISNHDFATGSESNIGLATYTTSNDTWSYFTSSTTGTISSGTGYAVKLASAGDISFSGTMKVDDTSIELTTSGNGYNLIGNPYPSYIDSGSILSNSSSALENQTLWIWNQSSSSYDAKVTIDAFKIAPGQGFFVKSDGDDGSILIDEDDQSHQSSDTFQRTDPRPEIHLTLSDDSNSKLAKIYYIDGATTGFDNGYDGPMFTGSNNSFAVYTHLVSDSEGVDYQIQSLPPDDYGNMVTPIGINAVSGSTISIEASTFDFPEGMNIYLEDKEDNSFTLLDGDANFTTTLESDLNGIGRFYLHTTTGSLSADDLSIRNNISIYNSSKENLRIVGVKNGTNAKVHLYTILGKEVFTTSFQGVRVNDILLPKLAEGVYIIKLSTMNSKTIKKIIL